LQQLQIIVLLKNRFCRHISLYKKFNMSISAVVKEDIPALVNLINSAYRGEASTKGWTTEAHLLKGDQRTDKEELQKLIGTSDAVMLKYINEGGELTGCVYLKQDSHSIYLGMLTVSPLAQSQGIGKKLLAEAENYTRKMNCNAINMTVISVRDELINWYQRHGYQPTGEIKPFPVDHQFGIPSQPLEFIVLEKRIAQQ